MMIKYNGISAIQEFPYTGVNAQWQPGQTSDISDTTRINALLAADGWSKVVTEIPVFNSAAEIPSAQGVYQVGNQLLTVGSDGFATGTNQIGNDYLVLSSFGNSIDNMGNASITTTNDFTSFTSPLPGTSTNITANGVVANMITGLYPMRRGVNCGVDGRTVATMLTDEQAASSTTSRKVLDTVNAAPDVVMFVGGAINDLTAATYTAGVISESSYQTIVANLKTEISYLISTLARLIIFCPALGYSTGLSGISGSPPANSNSGAGVRNAIIRLNNEMRAWCASLNASNLQCINPVGLSCDSTGAFFPGYVRTTDGVHPDYWGVYNICRGLENLLTAYFGQKPKSIFPGKNVARNAMMSEVSGGWPTDWSVNINANASLSNQQIEIINGVRWATADITATANNPNFFVRLPFNPSNTANGTIPAMSVAVNDIYGVECDFFIEGKNGAAIKNLALWQSYIRYASTAGGNPYLQPTYTYPQQTADILNHGRLQIHPNFVIKFADAGSGILNTGGWFAPFSAQTVQATAGDIFKIGVANYRIVKLS